MSDNTATILFDLDDTLLGNDMDRFIPRYFALLSEYARPLMADKEQFLAELMRGTQAMIANTDRSLTNSEVFWPLFLERTGLDPAGIEAFFDTFYRDEFPRLQPVTEPRPVAAELMRYCFRHEIQVAIATNPLFPRRAIAQRLAWAGVPVTEFDYALVTSYENMHATKPHRAYYREILARIDAEAATTMMVGDDWENDVEPAAALGMTVYWITPAGVDTAPPDPALISGHGTLDDFYHWLTDRSNG